MSALQIRAASTAVGQRSLGCLLLLRLRRLLLGVDVVVPLLPRRHCRRRRASKIDCERQAPGSQAGAMYEKYDGRLSNRSWH